MKKILTLLLAIMLCAFQTYAQYDVLDFESAAGGTGLTWTVDQNGTNPALAFPANPVSGGINTSATVAQFDAEAAGQTYALTYTTVDAFEFDATNSTIKIKVYKPYISDVAIKFEGGSSGDIEIKVANTVVNQWEELTFDFSSKIGSNYATLVIIPDFISSGSRVDHTLYFDDVQIPTGNYVAPPAPSNGNITFSVDMNDYINGGGSTTGGVFINGTFNGWNGTSNPMSDGDGDNVWDVILPLNAGAMEYKFTINGWVAQENLTPGTSCTVTNGGFTNRSLTVNGDQTVATVCWESCAACGVSTTGDITFSVDMTDYIAGGGSFTTVHLNGDFNGWCGTCNPMTDGDGDNVWETTLTLSNGAIEYKFTVDGWTGQENFVGGESCTVTNGGFTNRSYTVAGDASVGEVCWNACVICSAVPVELTYFNAKAEGNTNVLSWETATEENNSHFEVQRSFNGTDFEVIGIVEGNGTIYEVMNYNFIDEAPFANTYYRLRQVDFDGQFEYTEIVNVNRRKVGSNDVKMYPNPAQDNLTIDYTSSATEDVTITVTDMTGRVLISQNRNAVQGDNQLNIDLSELPRGNYFLQLKSTTTSTIQAIVKQ